MDWTREASQYAYDISMLYAHHRGPDSFRFAAWHIPTNIKIRPHRWSHDDALLHSRGWVLQEELLSRRILSYADDAIFWSCLRINASDSEPERSEPDTIHRTEDNHRFLRVVPGRRAPGNEVGGSCLLVMEKSRDPIHNAQSHLEKRPGSLQYQESLQRLRLFLTTSSSLVFGNVILPNIWLGGLGLRISHLAIWLMWGLEGSENRLVSANSPSEFFCRSVMVVAVGSGSNNLRQRFQIR